MQRDWLARTWKVRHTEHQKCGARCARRKTVSGKQNRGCWPPAVSGHASTWRSAQCFDHYNCIHLLQSLCLVPIAKHSGKGVFDDWEQGKVDKALANINMTRVLCCLKRSTVEINCMKRMGKWAKIQYSHRASGVCERMTYMCRSASDEGSMYLP